jgi:hypothetical protein
MRSLMNSKYQNQSSTGKREEFKKQAEEYYEDGVISTEERFFLDLFGLDESEATEILQAIKLAYYQHQSDLDRYRKLLVTDPGKFAAEKQQLLQQLQSDLGISDSEIEKIKKDISTEGAASTKEVNTEKNTMKFIQEDSTSKCSNFQSEHSQHKPSEKQDLLGQQKQGINGFVNQNNFSMAVNTVRTYAPVVRTAASILGILVAIVSNGETYTDPGLNEVNSDSYDC